MCVFTYLHMCFVKMYTVYIFLILYTLPPIHLLYENYLSKDKDRKIQLSVEKPWYLPIAHREKSLKYINIAFQALKMWPHLGFAALPPFPTSAYLTAVLHSICSGRLSRQCAYFHPHISVPLLILFLFTVHLPSPLPCDSWFCFKTRLQQHLSVRIAPTLYHIRTGHLFS